MPLTANAADALADHNIDRRRDRELDATFPVAPVPHREPEASAASLTAALKRAQEHLTWLRGRKAVHGSPAVFDGAIAEAVGRIDELDRKLAALTALAVAAE